VSRLPKSDTSARGPQRHSPLRPLAATRVPRSWHNCPRRSCGTNCASRPQAARIETITADVIAVEHEEAALVWLALDQGLTVEHRLDISPQALLGVC
jgi:hypothetical protein